MLDFEKIKEISLDIISNAKAVITSAENHNPEFILKDTSKMNEGIGKILKILIKGEK